MYFIVIIKLKFVTIKKIVSNILILALLAPYFIKFNYSYSYERKESHNIIAIFVEKEIFGDKVNNQYLYSRVIRYSKDIQKRYPNTKTLIYPTEKDTSVLDISNQLSNLYFNGDNKTEKNNLIGTVFIGDIPMPVVDINNKKEISVYPYTDFIDKAFVYDKERNSYVQTGTDNPKPEIWHGIIKPPVDGKNKEKLLMYFFDKNHLYHQGDTEFSVFDKKILYQDYLDQSKKINKSKLNNYNRFIKYMEDIEYLRYNKSLTYNFIEQIEKETSDLYETPDDSPFYNMELDSVPDILTKDIINKYISNYIEINKNYLNDIDPYIFNTGRWELELIDTLPSLVNQKDIYSKNLLRYLNDFFETKINNIIRLDFGGTNFVYHIEPTGQTLQTQLNDMFSGSPKNTLPVNKERYVEFIDKTGKKRVIYYPNFFRISSSKIQDINSVRVTDEITKKGKTLNSISKDIDIDSDTDYKQIFIDKLNEFSVELISETIAWVNMDPEEKQKYVFIKNLSKKNRTVPVVTPNGYEAMYFRGNGDSQSINLNLNDKDIEDPEYNKYIKILNKQNTVTAPIENDWDDECGNVYEGVEIWEWFPAIICWANNLEIDVSMSSECSGSNQPDQQIQDLLVDNRIKEIFREKGIDYKKRYDTKLTDNKYIIEPIPEKKVVYFKEQTPIPVYIYILDEYGDIKTDETGSFEITANEYINISNDTEYIKNGIGIIHFLPTQKTGKGEITIKYGGTTKTVSIPITDKRIDVKIYDDNTEINSTEAGSKKVILKTSILKADTLDTTDNDTFLKIVSTNRDRLQNDTMRMINGGLELWLNPGSRAETLDFKIESYNNTYAADTDIISFTTTPSKEALLTVTPNENILVPNLGTYIDIDIYDIYGNKLIGKEVDLDIQINDTGEINDSFDQDLAKEGIQIKTLDGGQRLYIKALKEGDLEISITANNNIKETFKLKVIPEIKIKLSKARYDKIPGSYIINGGLYDQNDQLLRYSNSTIKLGTVSTNAGVFASDGDMIINNGKGSLVFFPIPNKDKVSVSGTHLGYTKDQIDFEVLASTPYKISILNDTDTFETNNTYKLKLNVLDRYDKIVKNFDQPIKIKVTDISKDNAKLTKNEVYLNENGVAEIELKTFGNSGVVHIIAYTEGLLPGIKEFYIDSVIKSTDYINISPQVLYAALYGFPAGNFTQKNYFGGWQLFSGKTQAVSAFTGTSDIDSLITIEDNKVYTSNDYDISIKPDKDNLSIEVSDILGSILDIKYTTDKNTVLKEYKDINEKGIFFETTDIPDLVAIYTDDSINITLYDHDIFKIHKTGGLEIFNNNFRFELNTDTDNLVLDVSLGDLLIGKIHYIGILTNTDINILNNEYSTDYLYNGISTLEEKILCVYKKDSTSLDSVSGAGFRYNDKKLLLYASGNTIGGSIKNNLDFTEVLLGDPSIQLDTKEEDKSIGTQIFKDQSKTIKKVVPLDYNNDQITDIVISFNTGELRLLEGIAHNPYFIDKEYIARFGIKERAIAKINYNKDEYDDLLVVLENNDTFILENHNGVFTKTDFSFNKNSHLQNIELADLDQDGTDDFIVSFSNGNLSIIYGDTFEELVLGNAGAKLSRKNLIDTVYVSYDGITDNVFSIDNPLPDQTTETLGFDYLSNQPALNKSTKYAVSNKSLDIGDNIIFELNITSKTNIPNFWVMDPVDEMFEIKDFKCINCETDIDHTIEDGYIKIKDLSINKNETKIFTYIGKVKKTPIIKFGVSDLADPDGKTDNILDIIATTDSNNLGKPVYFYSTGKRSYKKHIKEAPPKNDINTDTNNDNIPDRLQTDINNNGNPDYIEENISRIINDDDGDTIPNYFDTPIKASGSIGIKGLDTTKFEIGAEGLEALNSINQSIDESIAMLKDIKCGGGCLNLPVNYAFFASGYINNALCNPQSGNGCPIGRASSMPIFWYPSAYPISTFRFYIIPTLNASLAISPCIGPAGSPLYPGGKCWPFAPKIPQMQEKCEAINEDIDNTLSKFNNFTRSVNSNKSVFSVGKGNYQLKGSGGGGGDGTPISVNLFNLGTYSKPITSGNFLRIPAFDEFGGVITRWFSKQTEEISKKLMVLPDIFIILPDPTGFLGTKNLTDFMDTKDTTANTKTNDKTIDKKQIELNNLLTEKLQSKNTEKQDILEQAITNKVYEIRREKEKKLGILTKQLAQEKANLKDIKDTTKKEKKQIEINKLEERKKILEQDINSFESETSKNNAYKDKDFIQRNSTKLRELIEDTKIYDNLQSKAKSKAKDIGNKIYVNEIRGVYRFLKSIPWLNIQEKTTTYKIPWLSKNATLQLLSSFEVWIQDTKEELSRVSASWSRLFSECDLGTESNLKDKISTNQTLSIPELYKLEICKQKELAISIQADVNKLISTVEKNMQTLNTYKNFPRQIVKYKRQLANYLGQVICYLDSITEMIGGYITKIEATLTQWITLVLTITEIVKDVGASINSFVDLQKECKLCTNERYNLSLFFPIGITVPEVPPIPFPKWPDVVLDVSQINPNLNIIIPNINFVAEEIVFPQLPNIKLPESPDISIGFSLPGIPLLPTLPELPNLPDLPPIPTVKLPDLPPPPKLPEFVAQIKGVIQTFKKLLKFYCMMKEVLIPIDEFELKEEVERLTSRPARLTKLDSISLEIPELSFPFIDEIQIISKINMQLSFGKTFDIITNSATEWNTIVTDLITESKTIMTGFIDKYKTYFDQSGWEPANININLNDLETLKGASKDIIKKIQQQLKENNIDDTNLNEFLEDIDNFDEALERYQNIQKDINKSSNIKGINTLINKLETQIKAINDPSQKLLTANEYIKKYNIDIDYKYINDIISKETINDNKVIDKINSIKTKIESYSDNKNIFSYIIKQSDSLISDTEINDTKLVEARYVSNTFNETITSYPIAISDNGPTTGPTNEIIAQYNLPISNTQTAYPKIDSLPTTTSDLCGILMLNKSSIETVVRLKEACSASTYVKLIDYDNDTDDDLFYSINGELYLKESTTKHNTAIYLDTDPEIKEIEPHTLIDLIQIDTEGNEYVNISWNNTEIEALEINISKNVNNWDMKTGNTYKQIFLMRDNPEDNPDTYLLEKNSFKLPIANGFYHLRIRALDGEYSEKKLIAPQPIYDTVSPIILVPDEFFVPIFKPLKINTDQVFDESKLEFIWEGDNGTKISDTEINLKPFTSTGSRDLTLQAKDLSGNTTEKKIKINVYSPELDIIKDTDIYGYTKPKTSGIPITLLRNRFGYWQKIITNDTGTYLTDNTGKYTVTDLNTDKGAIIKTDTNDIIAYIRPDTGRVVIKDRYIDRYTIDIISGDENYPMRTVILNNDKKIVANIFYVADINTDITINKQTEYGVNVMDTDETDNIYINSISAKAKNYAGGVIIHDTTDAIALIDTTGSIYLLDPSYDIKIKDHLNESDPVIYSITHNSRAIADILINSNFENINILNTETWATLDEYFVLEQKDYKRYISSDNSPFTDINKDHPNYNAIINLFNRGIIEGYGDGSFKPDTLISRAEFVKIALGATTCLDCTTPSQSEINRYGYEKPFPDVTDSDWHYFCVIKGKHLQMIEGYGDGLFKPQKNISKAEAVAVLLRKSNLELFEAPENSFFDVPDYAWYKDYIYSALKYGLIKDTVGFIEPDHEITRSEFAEMASILLRYKDCKLIDTDQDQIPDYFEIQYNLDPTDPEDSGNDPDGDGLSNLEEFQLDLDPNYKNSADTINKRKENNNNSGDSDTNTTNNDTPDTKNSTNTDNTDQTGSTKDNTNATGTTKDYTETTKDNTQTNPEDNTDTSPVYITETLCKDIPQTLNNVIYLNGCPYKQINRSKYIIEGVYIVPGDLCFFIDLLADIIPGDIIKAAIMSDTTIFTQSDQLEI